MLSFWVVSELTDAAIVVFTVLEVIRLSGLKCFLQNGRNDGCGGMKEEK